MRDEADAKNRGDLNRRLTLAVGAPMLLLLLVGALLGAQIVRMSHDSHALDHSDQVLDAAHAVEASVVEQETGMRGYLLSGDRAQLEPYDRAIAHELFAQLHDLTAENPGEQRKFDEARALYDDWHASVQRQLESGNVDAMRSATSMRERRNRFDPLRATLHRAIDDETDVRHTRLASATMSQTETRVAFVSLIGLAAVLLGFFSRSQLGAIAKTYGSALTAERDARDVVERETWLRGGVANLGAALQGAREMDALATSCLATLTRYTGADVGALFVKEGDAWKRASAYGIEDGGADRFGDREGLVGRAAHERKVVHLREVPADYWRVRSGTGESTPRELAIGPSCVDDAAVAVVELGFLQPMQQRVLELLERVGETVALAVRSVEYQRRLRELLEESQRQAEELQTQQEELRVANEELESQTTALREASARLESQQAELEQTNQELVSQSKLLEAQNHRLTETQAEVARASQYKSDFLSNMSHELRTPLNSALILAKLLADNKRGNLTEEQVRHARTIYEAGNDLLALINDVLDLSKIEAGKMDVQADHVPFAALEQSLHRTFDPVASEKGLQFLVDLRSGLPPAMETDRGRLDQILKNLVSNALKFTSEGQVDVSIEAVGDQIRFAVHDTGIGIDPAQHATIFESFRQADTAATRAYGGTGLGLSIARDLARLLGGDIGLESAQGRGSTFTLTLPRTPKAQPVAIAPVVPAPAPSRPVARLPEPTPKPDPGKRTILLVEDDPAFAEILSTIARDAGFEPILATTTDAGFQLAMKHHPYGVVLDMKLPDRTGLALLDRLKHTPETRHIPVHVVSAFDYAETALSMGAARYLLKPVKHDELVEAVGALTSVRREQTRRVLVIEDDATLRESIVALLSSDNVEIRTAGNAEAALAMIGSEHFDCIVTDLVLPGQSGFDLLEALAGRERYSMPPVIVYTGRALTPDEEQRLRKYSRSIIVKGTRSPERLLDEVTLFLHQVEADLPPERRRMLEATRDREAIFEGRTILIVEDDVRNVFSLTSVLEPKGAHVRVARTGKDALSMLEKERVDLVVMDWMMPEMDGLEATRAIRRSARFAKLPIIMLTAKAMRDDQQRCLAAGANDYLAKPLDVEMFLSLLRVWMPKAA